MTQRNTGRARKRAERLALHDAGVSPFEPAAEEFNIPVPQPAPDLDTPPAEHPLAPLVSVEEAESQALQEGPAEQGPLVALAQDINGRFALASRLDNRATEHRVGAALQLVKAKQECQARGINFMNWAKASVAQSRRTILLMVAIGSSPDPAKALEELRARNAQANREMAKRKKLAAPTLALASPDAPPTELPTEATAHQLPPPAEPAPTPALQLVADQKAPPASAPSRVERLLSEFMGMNKKEQREFIQRAQSVAARKQVA